MGPTLQKRGRAINSTEDVSPERAAPAGPAGIAARTMKNGTFVTSQPQRSRQSHSCSRLASQLLKSASDPCALRWPRLGHTRGSRGCSGGDKPHKDTGSLLGR